MKTLSLRMEDDQAEILRSLAFEQRTTQTEIIRSALDAYLNEARQVRPTLGCDVCGEAHVMVSTPGGFRFCEVHRPTESTTAADVGDRCGLCRLDIGSEHRTRDPQCLNRSNDG